MVIILLGVAYFVLFVIWLNIYFGDWLHPQENRNFSSSPSPMESSSMAPVQLVDQITLSQQIFPIVFVRVL